MNPDFFLLSALIDFLLVNVVLSTVALALERLTKRFLMTRWTARRLARFQFLLAVSPFLLSTLLILGLQVPAQLLYEPHEPTEYVTLRIFAVGLIGLLGMAFAVARQLTSWWMTLRFNARVVRYSRPVPSGEAPTVLPVFKIHHRLPLCCILGLRRPKLFLANQLFSELEVRELRGALAHEEAHWRQHDNLKYLVLNILKNLFFFLPTYRRLEEAWREAAEFACDEEAAELTRQPLDLASALVKIAKLTPPEAPTPAWLLAGLGLTDFTHSARLEQRVTRLISFADHLPCRERSWRPSRFSFWAGAAAIAALATLILEHNLLLSLHRAIEALEHFFM